MKGVFSKIANAGEGKLKGTLQFVSFMFTKPGRALLKKIAIRSLRKYGIIKEPQPDYNKWIKAQTNPALLKQNFEQTYSSLKLKPEIKIIITLTDTGAKYTQAAADSVTAQLYPDYEVHINDAHTQIDIALADYVLFTKADTLLAPNCLLEFAKHINAHPTHDIIYADEDTVDDNGNFSNPYFKPHWSPDTLLSRNYIGDTFLIKKDITIQLNRPGEQYKYNNHYDILLRATRLTNNIGHIPKILHHHPTHTSSAAKHAMAKEALKNALATRNITAEVADIPSISEAFQINYAISTHSKVSVIIPTKDNAALLKSAIDSILQKTNYPDYEIIVLNNNSATHEFFALVKEYTEKHPAIFRCVEANFPFNFARLINTGVAQSKGDYILMCNNDIEVIHKEWMTQMVSYAQHKNTGAVGAKLLYPDDTIQHAGIVLGINGDAAHVFVNKEKNDPGYFHSLKTVTNYAAVTAACLMCRKEVYLRAGGMDETLAVEYNDLDLCLRLLQKGYYNIYLPQVTLYHYESATRGHPFRSKASYKQHEKELAIFKHKWQPLIDNDPFYNPHLSRKHTDFSLK